MYKKACDGGSMIGCSNLGVLYEHGRGVTQSYEKALSYQEKACKQGDKIACSYAEIVKKKMK